MKIGFIGVGKLGKDAAEVMSYNHDVIGYDIQEVNTDKFDVVDSIEDVCKDRELIIMLIMMEDTPHHT